VSIPFTEPWFSKPVDDWYDSGAFGDSCVKIAPGFPWPGFSGGPVYEGDYFQGSHFEGIVSKVSASAEPFAVEITASCIKQVLEHGRRGDWIPTPQGYRVRLQEGHDTIISGPQTGGFESTGGAVTGGGGAVTGGGGAISGGGAITGGGGPGKGYIQIGVENQRIRVIPDPKTGGFQYIPYSEKQNATLINPSSFKSEGMLLNGREVAFFEVRDQGPEGKTLSLPPLMATYVWLERHQPKEVIPHYVDEHPQQQLWSLRVGSAEQLKFARLYREDSPDRYSILNSNCDTQIGDSAQALFPEFDRLPTGSKTYIGKNGSTSVPSALSGCVRNKSKLSLLQAGLYEGFPHFRRAIP
jgi:hypothetical protein